MAADTQSPVLFLSFANEQAQSARYLRNLPEELSRLRQILDQAHAPYQVIFYPNLKIEELLDGLRRYRRRIALFHYGGHSNSYSLLLQSLNEQPVVAHAGGLAKLLAHQHGLHLIFLNGCSNRTQAQALLEAGIAVVIATSAAINDQVAMEFAAHFYEELARDATIAEAFQRAEATIEVQYGSNSRHLVDVSSPAEIAEAPWQLYYRDEAAIQWRLADVIDNPCWGLPPLPQQPLPQQPFRHLAWFRHEDAELFFGRCTELRDLYEGVVDPTGAPVILLYGQSGVGKSSLLDAGLLPRLAADTVCRYRRRDHDAGLAADLTAALRFPTSDQPAADPPLHDAWRTREAEVRKPLVIILDQVEEVFTRPHPNRPDELADFLQVVQAIFVQGDRPPQGKLILSFRKEFLAELEKRLQEQSIPFVKTFLEPLNKQGIIEAITGIAHTPRLAKQYGLVVGDELPAIIADDLLDDRESPLAPTLQILLTKMWEQATIRNQSRPVFDETLYRDLKREGIALQDFLTQQLQTLRTLDRAAVDSGLALDLLVYHTTSFGTAEQHNVAKIIDLYTDEQHRKGAIPTVKQGLFSRSSISLPDTPAHSDTQNLVDVHTRLKQLVQRCKDLYLLTEAAGDQATEEISRLAHDALAPLLRVRFDRSDAPGQRARRVLENRAREWQDGKQGTPLDEQDLSLVEQGQHGMRAWTPDERRLVVASRHARTRRRWTRRGVGFAAVIAVVIFLAYAGFTWLHDENQANRLMLQEAQRLATLALQQITVDPVASLVLARQALPNPAEPKPYLPQAELALTQALQTSLERVYRQVSQPPLTAGQVAFGKSAIAVGGDALRLATNFLEGSITTLTTESELIAAVTWDEAGETLLGRGSRRAYVWHAGQPLITQEFNQLLACAEWQPGRPRIAICSGNSLRLWSYADSTIEPIHDFAQNVLSAQWSPDGSLLAAWDIAPQAGTQTLLVWNAQTKQIELTTTISDTQRIKTVVWSPDGQHLAVGLATATVQIWPVQQRSTPLMYKSGQNVDDLVFVDESRLLTWGVGDSVRLWSIAGEELQQFGENAGVVQGIQLTPDQQSVLIFLDNGSAQEYAIATGERLVSYTGHRRRILTAAWRNGYLATSSIDGTARIWDATSGQAVTTLAGHTGSIPDRADVLGVHWLADGRLMTYGEDGSLRIWQLFDEQGLPLCNDINHSGQPRCYAHSRAFPAYTEEIAFARWLDDDTILTVEQDGTAQRLTLSTGATMSQPAEPDLYPEVRWDPQGERLFTYLEEAFLEEGQSPNGIVRDFLTGERLAEIPGPIASAFWLDGAILISRETAEAQLVDPAAGVPLAHLSTITSVVTAAQINSSRQLAVATEDGIIHIVNTQTGAETIRLGDDETAENLPVSKLHWTMDGKRLLTAGSNIALWDVERGRKLWTTPGNLFNTAHAAFSPDERFVAGTLDTAVFVLDAETGIPQTEEIQQAHTALINGIQWLRDRQWPYQDDYPPLVSRFMRWINGAAWNADNTRFLLLTWSEDGAATLWDWENRAAIMQLGELDRISVAAVSPDGSQILTASTTEAMDVIRVRIWPSWRQAPDDLLQLATEHAIRTLSPTQLEQFAIP